MNNTERYVITAETLEVNYSDSYDQLLTNIRSKDLDQDDILYFDNKIDAEKAFDKIISDNPPTLPRIHNNNHSRLAYIKVWLLEKRTFGEDAPDGTFDAEYASTIDYLNMHYNTPTPEQFYDELKIQENDND